MGLLARLDYMSGRSKYDERRYPEAEKDFESALAKNPLYAKPRYYLGLIKISRNQFDEALADMRAALKAREDRRLDYPEARSEIQKLEQLISQRKTAAEQAEKLTRRQKKAEFIQQESLRRASELSKLLESCLGEANFFHRDLLWSWLKQRSLYEAMSDCRRRALEFFKIKSEQGNPIATVCLSKMWSDKELDPNGDPQQAVASLVSIVDQTPMAALQLALFYFYGLGCEKDLEKVVIYARKAEEKKYVPVYNLLGWLYESGSGFPRDLKAAYDYYVKGAEQHHSYAEYNLARCYEHGIGVEKNPAQAFIWCEKSAKSVCPEALNLLGFYYQTGFGVSQNLTQGLSFYYRAADAGSALAQDNLGYAYQEGKGVQPNSKKAVKWYRLSAGQGLMSAERHLAYCYEMGLEVDQSEEEAAKWYELAANKGDRYAQNNLARFYESGKGVLKDLKKAFDLYELSAKQGYDVAQNNMGRCYRGALGVARDYQKALEWFRKAADQNNQHAFENLGYMYLNGEGVDKNVSEAIRHFGRAVELGNADAMNQLGYMYSEGIGVVKNNATAFQYFNMGARLDHAASIANIGVCYEYGKGVMVDRKKAKACYEEAMQKGSTFGRQKLIEACMNHMFGSVDYQRAVQLLQLAIGINQDQWSRYQLMGLYQNGWGVKKDIDHMRKMLIDLADEKYIPAQLKLARRYLTKVPAHFRSDKTYFDEYDPAKAIRLLFSILDVDAENRNAGLLLSEIEKEESGIYQEELRRRKEEKQRERERALATERAQEEGTRRARLEDEIRKLAEEAAEARAKQVMGAASASSVPVVSPTPSVAQPNFSIIPYTDIQFTNKVLGQGGFGVVKEAEWQHVRVAVKELKAALTLDGALQFKGEAERHGALRHPNIVALFAVCMESVKYCMVMELMEMSLFDFLRSSQTLPWSILLRIAMDISVGLAYLHSVGITHGDLKSLNVLLDDRFRARLTDFGLSKVKSEVSSSTGGGGTGTLAWMAPELFERLAKITQASDVYALGVVFWEIAARKIPFGDAINPALIPSWVQTGDRETIPEKTPKKFAALITRCWDGRVENRPSANSVVEELSSIMREGVDEPSSSVTSQGYLFSK